MIAEDGADVAASSVAAAIGEPARARMLYSLMDGRARTSTELAVIAEVGPSTASTHLQRLASEGLVSVVAQGKHRYYRLADPAVAAVLEGLSVIAGTSSVFVAKTPDRLRAARTCYDHMAGAVAVAVHDRFLAAGWLVVSAEPGAGYTVSAGGSRALEPLGIDVAQLRTLRRRFAYGYVDWSERRPHVGGALGAALLGAALRKRWVTQHDDCRALALTSLGRRELQARFGVCFS